MKLCLFEKLPNPIGLLREILRLRKENNVLREKLRVDDLTGLFNALCLRERLGDCVKGMQESGLEPALLFIDVDRFKEINEAHGHVAAGKILGQVGRIIAQVIRAGDVAFRYGGDEFVVLVSGGRHGAMQAADRVRGRIASHLFSANGLRGKAIVRITVSVGLRTIEANDHMETILEDADRAMFEAKRNSRNALVAA